MCSKSVSSSTFSTPPFLPPSSGCVSGLWNPLELSAALEPDPLELVELVLELLDPQADSASASAAVSATPPVALIAFMCCLLCCVRCPDGHSPFSSNIPRVEGILQPIAQQVEGQHREQQRQAGEGHVPPRGVEDRRRRGDHLPPARGRRADADAEE